MRFTNFTLLYVTISFCVGIILANYISPSLTTCFYIFTPCILALFTCFLLFKQTDKTKTFLFTAVSLICFVGLGAITQQVHVASSKQNHYHLNKSYSNTHKLLRISQNLKDNKFYSKFYAELISIDSNTTSGTILIQLKKDSTLHLKPDDYIITSTEFTEVQSALNPGQFDYKNYLKHKGVYHQLYLDAFNFKKISTKNETYNGLNAAFILKINQKLKNYNFKPDELAIINALVLGQKQDISSEIYNSYTDSGAIHILAVSGLHIGIILLIITFLLKPLNYLKRGKLITIGISILLLWFYAYLTGLSPSVVRATSMFTMVAIAINLKRKTNTYNTLIGSIFIILVFKPQFLFDVGFQLSYAAVFSIVAFQPLIAKLWRPKHRWINLYWQTLTVTLSAQFGILPLSVFYFHQIPGLFWLSNLIIIPLLPIILGLSIFVIALVLITDKNSVVNLFVSILAYIISSMNQLLQWISSMETFIFKEISFNNYNLISSLGLVMCIYFMWKYFSAKTILLTLTAILLVQTSFVLASYKHSNNELVVFHRSKHSIISVKTNRHLMIYSDSLKPNYISTNYKVKNGITKVAYDSMPSIFSFNNKTILIIDSLGLYPKSLKPDVIILTKSPKVNLNRLIDDLQPKQIVSDGSNYKSYITTWQKTSKNKKTPFHYTENGAFILTED